MAIRLASSLNSGEHSQEKLLVVSVVRLALHDLVEELNAGRHVTIPQRVKDEVVFSDIWTDKAWIKNMDTEELGTILGNDCQAVMDAMINEKENQ